MSISLIISNPGTDEQRLVNIPIATEDAFQKIWQTGCSELSLRYVSLFDTGVEIEQNDVGELTAELTKLHHWTEMLKPQTEQIAQMQTRLKRLINEIPEIVDEKTKVYIG